jgi:hypothetical protein
MVERSPSTPHCASKIPHIVSVKGDCGVPIYNSFLEEFQELTAEEGRLLMV